MFPEINAEIPQLMAELAQLLSCTDHVQHYLNNEEEKKNNLYF